MAAIESVIEVGIEFTISVACLSAFTFGMEIGIMVIMESREKRRNSSMSDFENCEKRRIYNIQYVKKGESIVFNILHEVIEHWSLVRKIIQLFSYETSGNN